MKLRTIKDEVHELLIKYPETRSSDEKLYGTYLQGRIGLISAIQFFLDFAKYENIASFETVSRCRRKLQEEDKSLLPPKVVLEARNERQGSFFDFSRGFEDGEI